MAIEIGTGSVPNGDMHPMDVRKPQLYIHYLESIILVFLFVDIIFYTNCCFTQTTR
jgi:hypothetical protein